MVVHAATNPSREARPCPQPERAAQTEPPPRRARPAAPVGCGGAAAPGGLRLALDRGEPSPRYRALRRRTVLPRPRGLGDLLEAVEGDGRRRVLQGPLPAGGGLRPSSAGQPARRPHAAP